MSDSSLQDIRIGQVSHQWSQAQKIPAQYFDSIDSTNKKAREEAFNENSLSEHLIIYFADMQSAGKGRGSNTWITPHKGSQLLSTWSFMIESAPLPVLSPLIGLALYRAAVSTWPFLDWNLKAPNDLYIAEKKIAGLLIENVTQGTDTRLLIGLGFNVLAHPGEIANSTSLAESLAARTPLLAQDWISFLERLIFEFSISIQLAFEPLNTTCSAALLTALNKHPLLKELYISLDEQGNLKTEHRQISWMEL
ncbi:MAG: biotin--[acetyl-CoA-carboxylase] ligase [Pseudobdellovibrio sp.]